MSSGVAMEFLSRFSFLIFNDIKGTESRSSQSKRLIELQDFAE